MLKILKKIIRIISAEDRRKIGILLAVNTLSSITGIAGIASVIPFISVLSDPEKIFSNQTYRQIYDYLGFQDARSFVLLSGGVLLFTLSIANIFSAGAAWYNIHTAKSISLNLSRGMFKTYLNKDYSFFLKRNSSDLVKNLFSEATLAVTRVIQPFIDMISKSLFIIFIMIFLAAITPSVVYISIGVLAALSLLLYMLIRKRLKSSGLRAVEANRERFFTAGETFGAIREIKLSGNENFFIDKFTQSELRFEKEYAALTAMSRIPKFAIEVIAFGGVLGAALSLYAAGGGISGTLPFMALYAFAGYRMLPAVQQILGDLAGIRGSAPSIEVLYRELHGYNNKITLTDNSRDLIPFSRSIRLEGISFSYEGETRSALSDINIEIKLNETIGFVGPTGCGKTTLINIIAGLLRPERGRIITDGVDIDSSNISAWRKKIGCVPQQIFLLDDTVTRNIAFGINDSDIDIDRVMLAAKTANIHDLIISRFSKGYETIVGERGARISGGERQRLAIARALYPDPELLIFDEATSALDSETESAVMDAIDALAGKKTIIIVAHRLTTLKKCSGIYNIHEGRIVSKGAWNEFLSNSSIIGK